MGKYNDFEIVGMKYHYLTEKYDRSICRSRSPYSGDALPVTPEERRLSNTYAREVLQDLRKENPWMTSEDIHHAIQDAAQYKFDYLVEIFENYEQLNQKPI